MSHVWPGTTQSGPPRFTASTGRFVSSSLARCTRDGGALGGRVVGRAAAVRLLRVASGHRPRLFTAKSNRHIKAPLACAAHAHARRALATGFVELKTFRQMAVTRRWEATGSWRDTPSLRRFVELPAGILEGVTC